MTIRMYLDCDKLRNICIVNEWYTSGDNAEYEALFDFVQLVNHEQSANTHRRPRKTWTKRNILSVAENILDHSKPYNISSIIDENDRDELLARILFEIYNNIAYYCISMEA